ncbi:MAG TPA: hypothetical protein VGF99_16020, partial [Myxococcota bacterium]
AVRVGAPDDDDVTTGVANYLSTAGVTKSRFEIRSRGADDATADPYGWHYDRRVSILLAP